MTSDLVYSPPPVPADLPGTFVVFEGGDGTGKSTQARILADLLRSRHPDVVLTREPGGTEIGEQLRELVLGHGKGEIDAHTEALIYAASRAAHARQVIEPALRRGGIVVCDRYIESSAAYQGGGRELGEDAVTSLSRWATGDLLPDLTIYLRLPLAAARDRVSGRGAGTDRLESEPDAFHDRVRASFERLAVSGPGRAVLDAEGTVDDVAARVRAAVAQAFPRLLAESEAGAPDRETGATARGPAAEGGSTR